MKTFPLKSITIEQAINKQFKMVESISKEFKSSELLDLGDLGVHPNGNIPQTTMKVERAVANFFEQESGVFVRGAGTGAIREALSSVLKPSDKVLVHISPMYSTTKTTFEQLGLVAITCDFNQDEEVRKSLNSDIKAVLIQYTRQAIEDQYEMKHLIQLIKSCGNYPIITDDNYAVMKVEKIGVELGADLSCFSCFKLLGPQGLGFVVGKKKYTDIIRSFHYSGGSQTQGFEALEAMRGLVFSPVTHAIQAREIEKVCSRLNSGEIEGVSQALIANAQSKVLLVKFNEPIAVEVLKQAQELGACAHPIGAESKFEIVPMFYRLSGTMRSQGEEYTTHWIRINPMRSGSDTVIRILRESMKKVISCF